jgi:hypothetical protein
MERRTLKTTKEGGRSLAWLCDKVDLLKSFQSKLDPFRVCTLLVPETKRVASQVERLNVIQLDQYNRSRLVVPDRYVVQTTEVVGTLEQLDAWNAPTRTLQPLTTKN